MATILVLNVKVPFTLGGQDVLTATLAKTLKERGHTVDVIELPYSPFPKESLPQQAALWRSLDLTEVVGRKVDCVIATKFPSYFVKHPCKVLWLVHQHRPAYELHGGRFSDLSDDPRDEQLRQLLVEADGKALQECVLRTGISRTVCDRLQSYNGLAATPLLPPLPQGDRYFSKPAESFILSVGRICSIKRVDMMIKALPMIHRSITLKIVGTPDEPTIMEYLQNEIAKHHLQDRVTFLGRVSDAELLELYARAFAVYYAPFNEDYGYVTLEAMASSKPVITAKDSGGTLEFVQDGVTGIIAEPTVDGIAKAANELIEQPQHAQALGIAGRAWIESSGLLGYGWDHVVNTLLAPLAGAAQEAA